MQPKLDSDDFWQQATLDAERQLRERSAQEGTAKFVAKQLLKLGAFIVCFLLIIVVV